MNRKRRRRIHYRPGNRRGLRVLRGALVCVLAVSLMLSARVIVRSVRTARLNRRLAALHTIDGERPEAEIAAPPMGAGRDTLQAQTASPVHLAMMTLPDGSAIETVAEAQLPRSFHRTSGDVLPDMLKLLRENRDTVGWLYIDGVVHLPVVYRDNAYYLTHDFEGRENASGTLFLDQAAPVAQQTQNLLIHGHSMYDGSMFGLLTHYRKLDKLIQQPLISFSTLWEKETYAVFAVMIVPGDLGAADAFDYSSHPFFASDAEFDEYIEAVRARSMYDIPVDVRPTDALLTLSTCLDDDRLVILARKQRDGESRDALISAVEASRGRGEG